MSTGAVIHRFSHEAMATTFEVRVAGAEARYARQASEAVFALVDRLEALLSRYQEGSDVWNVARLGPGDVARVSPETFACLRLALEMQALTGGAFHPALGAWTDRRRAGEGRGEGEPACGRLLLDETTQAVQVLDAPVPLDLGAIGKGFALDRAAELLGEWQIDRALLVGGEGSSVLALAGPAPGEAWTVRAGGREFSLEQRASGTSGTEVQGEHVFDPLTGGPARAALRAWVFDGSAAVADALSTACMSLAPEEISEVCRLRTGLGALVLRTPGEFLRFGDLPASPGGQG